jgi:xylulokinase
MEVAGRAGIRLSEIRSVGGGTRSALWNQIKADVLGIPVCLPEAAVGAPFGDAVLAGMGLDFYPDVRRALRDMVRVKTRFEPNMENHSKYRDIYRMFRKLYEHLRNDFDEMAGLAGV